MVGRSAAGDDRGEDFYDQRETVALVRAGRGAGAAERENAAARLGVDVVDDALGVGGVLTVFIDGPAERHGLALLGIDLQLAARHDRGRHVVQHGNGIGRHGEGDGVCAEHDLAAERRHADGLRIRKAHAEHILALGHHGIIAADAEVVGVAHDRRTEAVLLRLGNGALHRVHGGNLAHGAVRVEHDGERRFMHDLRHGVWADHAAFHTAVVADQSLHAVGFQSLQIGGEQNVGNIAALFFVESVFAHNGFAVRAKLLFRQTIVRHMSLSFLYRTGSNLFDRLYHIRTKEKSLFRRKKTAHGILQKDIGKSPGRTYNYGRTLSGRNGRWINTRC